MPDPLFYPVKSYNTNTRKNLEAGVKVAKKGKVACFLLAGGVGSRLGIYGAKGCFPITPIQKKSFFQQIFERIKAYEEAFHCKVEIGVMLSSSTEKSVKKFFQSKDYFGLKKSQVTFFVQNNLAYLDEKLKPVKVEGKIVKAGDGNGGAIQVLQNSNWLKKLSRKKVEYLHVVPIDNALLDPLNLAMTGILSLKKWDALIAATKRGKKDKNFGALVQKEGKVTVIDYMELPKTYLEKPLEKVFPYINISHYCLKLSWLNSVLLEAELPIHWVKKKIPNRKNWVWKREMFFFDLFSYSDKIGAVYLPKDKYFYPLKEPADLSKVQKALQKRDRKLLGALGLQKLAKGPYELSSEFFYLTEELKEVISHRKLPSQGYVSLKTLEG